MSRNRLTTRDGARLDEVRRRGLSRVAPITAGIVLAGGAVSVSTAVALAATRTPAGTATAPAGPASTTAPADGSVPVPRHPGEQRPPQPRPAGNRAAHQRPAQRQVPQDNGGVAPSGNNPPQGQSQGS